MQFDLTQLNRSEIAAVCRDNGIRLLVAFGSRASGEAADASDLDLAALLEHELGMLEQFKLQDTLGKTLRFAGDIDLIIINDLSSTTLGREITQNGKVLFDCDGEQWPTFVSRAIREWIDFGRFRTLREKYLRGEPLE